MTLDPGRYRMQRRGPGFEDRAAQTGRFQPVGFDRGDRQTGRIGAQRYLGQPRAEEGPRACWNGVPFRCGNRRASLRSAQPR